MTQNLIFKQQDKCCLSRAIEQPVEKLSVEKLIALLIKLTTNEEGGGGGGMRHYITGIRAKRIKFEKTGLENERNTEPSASKLNNDPSLDDLTR